MLFTFKWLKQYLDTTHNLKQITDKLDNIGFEVEGVESKAAIYENFIVAEILDAKPHPNADSLKICEVSDGDAKHQVVCGAKNARAGIKVVMAKIGAVVPSNQMQIKKSKIRDIESHGMLCSAVELCFGDDDEGIIELPSSAKIGQAFAKYANFDDTTIDLALTPNRGDGASVRGIARDLAAAGIGKLKPIEQAKLDKLTDAKLFDLKAKDMVHEFSLIKIDGVQNHDSAKDVSEFLTTIGSSNNGALVDISNYAMLSLGRPNHIFDADKIDGQICVRDSKADESFLALNGEECTLPAGLTVISDDQKILALAGVIGGESSKVDSNTTNILIEVANFTKEAVVNSGRAINVHTDARYRFERGIDPLSTDEFNGYITGLILHHCGGTLISKQIARGAEMCAERSIKYSHADFEKLTGFEIEQSELDSTLKALGFTKKADSFSVPSFRIHDVEGSADLTEEVLRLIGPDRIEAEPFAINPNVVAPQLADKIDALRHKISANGYNEQITWSFYHEDDACDSQKAIQISNPISHDMITMRQSIVPNLLRAMHRNKLRGKDNIKFFEIGAVFENGQEVQKLCCIITGKNCVNNLYNDIRPIDFFDIKADFELAVKSLGFNPEKLIMKRDVKKLYHPQISASYFLGKNEIAQIGKLHPLLLKKHKIKDKNTFAFELNLSKLPIKLTPKFKAPYLGDLQHVKRDLAFFVPNDFEVASLVNFIKGVDKKHIEHVELFDNYVNDEQRSVAVNLNLAPTDKTFTDAEIEAIIKNVIDKVEHKFNFKLRSAGG